MTETTSRWVCPGCGYVYDEGTGDAHEGFAPGTAWSEVPDEWPARTAACATRPTSSRRMPEPVHE